jgi:hypothetical protein
MDEFLVWKTNKVLLRREGAFCCNSNSLERMPDL